MTDGRQDVVDRTAPQPVVIIEVGIAGRTLRAGAVALHAIDAEGGSATGNRILAQVFVRQNLVDVLGLDLVDDALPLAVDAGGFFPESAAARPPEHAAGGT